MAPEPPSAAPSPDAVDYPAHRAADVVLSDGGTVHLRPIRPADAPGILALHSRFSDRTRYLRYFSPYPRIPERDLRRFVTVDHHDREAFVAELGDTLIAVGRYDRLDPDEAEVAFVVEDAHQRRGLGSVLLEHLAAAAGEERIGRFVAEVLPENGTMLRVFSDAGYTVDRSYADGVVHLTFEIAPTERSVEVAREREQRTEAASIARLLAPRSVAVVGASTRPGTVGHALLRNLLGPGHRDAAGRPTGAGGGFTGPVYPIHPTAKTVRGLPAYASVRDIGAPVDLALVAVPADRVAGVVADCAAVGVHGLVIVSSGFGELGEEGLAAQRALVDEARAHGMRVVGPNCLGIANTDPAVHLNATLSPALPDRGRVGFFSQSGALGVALLAEAHRRGLGLSSFVSAGNRADVSGNDLLQYWQDDPATDLVLLYLETFGNPRKFARLARRLARRKPVVAVASRRGRPPGLSGVGPAPDERAVAALFAESGVIRVDTVSELFDVGRLLAHQPLPGGDRVGVVGNSTALGVLAVEALRDVALTVPPGYPVDVGPTATSREFAAALRRAVRDPATDALVAVFVPPLAVPSAAYADVLLAETAGGTKPVVATFVAGDEHRSFAAEQGAEVRGSRPRDAGGDEHRSFAAEQGAEVRGSRPRDAGGDEHRSFAAEQGAEVRGSRPRDAGGDEHRSFAAEQGAEVRGSRPRDAGGDEHRSFAAEQGAEVRGSRSDGTDGAAAGWAAGAGVSTQARLSSPGPDGAPGPGTVPAYDSVEEAVRALGRVSRYAHWRRTPTGPVPVLSDVDTVGARAWLAAELRDDPTARTLTDDQAAPLLSRYGIAVEPSVRVESADAAVAAADRLGYPVAMKVADGPLRHRVDLGGVRLDLAGEADVRRAHRQTTERLGPVAVVVQRMRPPGVACVVDLVEDPAFGSVLGFGLAGVATELFGDHAWRTAPLSAADAAALVRAPAAAPLLFGAVDSPDDLEPLADLLVRLGLLADEQPQVRAVSLNPVLVAGGRDAPPTAPGLAVLHATVHIGSAGPRPDSGPRRLR